MDKKEFAIGSPEWIEYVCTYQPATPEQMVSYTAINEASQAMMKVIFEHVPFCADRSAAIRLIREVRMTANAAVALNGLI